MFARLAAIRLTCEPGADTVPASVRAPALVNVKLPLPELEVFNASAAAPMF